MYVRYHLDTPWSGYERDTFNPVTQWEYDTNTTLFRLVYCEVGYLIIRSMKKLISKVRSSHDRCSIDEYMIYYKSIFLWEYGIDRRFNKGFTFDPIYQKLWK